MIPLHTAWNIGEHSFAELIRRGLERREGRAAVADESGSPMLGDDLIPEPAGVRTLAIEADVALPEMQPWLAQMLRGGGVQGWAELESKAIHSADYLIEGIPLPAVGDRCGNFLQIVRIDEGREIVWRSIDQLSVMGNPVECLTLDYLLRPVAEHRTRLLARARIDAPRLTRQVLLHLLDTIELALIGAQLKSIKRCAETWRRRKITGDMNRGRAERHQHLEVYTSTSPSRIA